MHLIKNLTNSPHDLETIDGSVRVAAMGEAKGEFAPEYLAALKGIGMFEVAEVQKAPAAKKPAKG